MKRFASTVAVLALTTAPALAQVSAIAATDLNLRAGPDTVFTATSVINRGDMVTVNGCVETSDWCDVDYMGMQGWAYAPYLAVEVDGNYTAISSNPAGFEVDTVTFTPVEEQLEQNEAAVAGATFGTIAAIALGGPVGGVIAGGILGASAGAIAEEPDETVITFVTANTVEDVRLLGEPVIGARVPLDQVTVYDVPDEPMFKYLYLNGKPAVVTAEEGTIVYLGS